MSNAGRPRTGLKKCPHCADTTRDSNGQCHCRNVLYRALRGTAKATAEKARRVYNDALKANKGNIDKALTEMREEFPSLAAKTRKAPADKKPKAEKKTPAQKKAAVKKADKIIDEAKQKAAEAAKADEPKAEPERYVLHIEDEWTDPKPYARKDAAIKNGVRSGEAWRVVYKGKVVAVSDDVL